MFADRLRQQRKEHGYTQVSLAKTMGVSKGTVAMWETGKRTPDFSMLIKIADLFDKRLDYVLGRTDDDSSPKPSEKENEQLGKWGLESQFTDIIKMYLSLDEYGRAAVENLIRSECLRCHDQKTINATSEIRVNLQIR